MSAATSSAARVRPPSQSNKTHIAVAAGAVSAVTATGVGDASDYWFSVVVSTAHNITFSDDGTNTVTDPTDVGAFPAGYVHSYELNKRNTHFKVRAVTGGGDATVTYWHSSRT